MPAKHELSDARVVVIGGGIAGCSAAYHLAQLGVTDVLLLERATLSSGTTWHSTGNMETYRDDPLIFSMVRYALESFARLQSEGEQEIGWRNVGRVVYTDREERLALFKTLPELGRIRGIELELLSSKDLVRHLPILDPAGLLGGVWVPSDGRVNPTDLVMAYARAARARGVRIRERIEGLEIIVRDGSVCGVATDQGIVGCETIIVAAGLWSGEVVRSCGLKLPLYSLEHQYLITKPIANLDRNMPLFLSYDDQLYGREEVGGLIVGSLDDHAVPISTVELPQNFAHALLAERWEQFEPYMTTAMRRFPVLRSAELRMLLNGPESFTADGQMLLGPIPGVDGLYCSCGFNSTGIALSPAAGKFIAEWIVEGEPSADLARLDVRRFAATQTTETYMRERATEIPGYFCRIHGPGDDYATSRNIRLSPVHAQLVAAGAHFTSVSGWERPLWLTQSNSEYRWLDVVAAEVGAAANTAIAVDRSADTKIALIGAGAAGWLAARLAFHGPFSGSRACVFACPGPSGQIEVLGRVLPWDNAWLLTTGPEQDSRLKEWLRKARLPNDVQAVDLSAGLALFELEGPEVASVLSELLTARGAARNSVSDGPLWAGSVETRLVVDPIHESTLLVLPADGANYVWARLLLAGRPFALRPAGHFAQEARRIERGIPRFGQDATPSTHVDAIFGSQLVSAIDTPSAHLSAGGIEHEFRFLTAFTTPMGPPGFGSHEAVLAGEQVVGELTSRAWIPLWQETLSLALLRTDASTLSTLELVADGRRWPLMHRSTHWQAAPESRATANPPFSPGPEVRHRHDR